MSRDMGEVNAALLRPSPRQAAGATRHGWTGCGFGRVRGRRTDGQELAFSRGEGQPCDWVLADGLQHGTRPFSFAAGQPWTEGEAQPTQGEVQLDLWRTSWVSSGRPRPMWCSGAWDSTMLLASGPTGAFLQ